MRCPLCREVGYEGSRCRGLMRCQLCGYRSGLIKCMQAV